MTDTFDPSKSCPIMKGIWCAETECVFWNAELSRCGAVPLPPTSDYNERTGNLAPATGEYIVNLGAVFKDITIYVDWDTRLKFGATGNPAIDLTVANGRVGVPVMFEGINAQYVLITALDMTMNYIITGNC